MKKIVETYLQENNILSKNKTFIIAFSGGFDSMTLAHILIELSQKYHFKIVLAHLNHNWRGEKSLKEAINCEKFAKQYNVEFYTETLDENLPHTETIAREERYKFFERAADKYNSEIILTAHTKSDNIETVLQRIIKGTGISGLQGIKDIRELNNNKKVYRPLLNSTRADILKYCEKYKLIPNNDNSNKDTKYLRNRIRENLIPDLKNNYDKNVEKAILRLIQNAIDEEEIIEEFLKKELEKIFDDENILTKEFLKLKLPLKKRIVKNLLEKNNFDYDQKRIKEVLNFIEDTSKSKAGKTFSLDKNHWLFVNNKITQIIDESDYNSVFAKKEINMNGETILEEFNAVVKITKWEGDAPENFPKDTDNVAFMNLSNIKTPLTFRLREYGDVIVPFGKKTPIKLKKYLNNKNLSKHEKSKVLLITSGKNVLWAINLGISNNIRVNGMPTHKAEFFYKEK